MKKGIRKEEGENQTLGLKKHRELVISDQSTAGNGN